RQEHEEVAGLSDTRARGGSGQRLPGECDTDGSNPPLPVRDLNRKRRIGKPWMRPLPGADGVAGMFRQEGRRNLMKGGGIEAGGAEDRVGSDGRKGIARPGNRVEREQLSV